jgi:hypothetical protein
VSETKQTQLWQLVQNTEGLTQAQKEQLYLTLSSFADVFSENEDDLGRTGIIRLTINTNGAAPVRQPPHCIPKHRQEEASTLVKKMLENNIIEPSKSPCSSPVVLVHKKDGTARLY